MLKLRALPAACCRCLAIGLLVAGALAGCAADAGRVFTTASATFSSAAPAPLHADKAMHQAGNGSPAVIFQAGLGDGAEAWERVGALLSGATTVIRLDRPGYGNNPLTEGARDPCTIAAEQHQLLHAQGVAPPYVLVGHSLGGLYQYVYARLYPQDVAALVLVDATHPDHWKRMQADAPNTATVMKGVRLMFGAAARREFDDQLLCLDRLSREPLQTEAHIPVRLLVRSDYALGERGAFETMVKQLQLDWLTLTGASKIETVAGAGHYIQKEKPEAVVAAILEQISAARSAATGPDGAAEKTGL